MNLEQLKQIAKSLNILDKVVKVEESKKPAWSVGSEVFYNEEDAYVWAINCALPTELSECKMCRLKVKSCPKCAL